MVANWASLNLRRACSLLPVLASWLALGANKGLVYCKFPPLDPVPRLSPDRRPTAPMGGSLGLRFKQPLRPGIDSTPHTSHERTRLTSH